MILLTGKVELEATVLIHAIVFSTLVMSFAGRLTDLNNQLSLLINSVAGRPWVFDKIAAFFLGNHLSQAGGIGCCFLAAGEGGATPQKTNIPRQIFVTKRI